MSTTLEQTQNAVNAERTAPAWYEDVLQYFLHGEGHMVLSHGNIYDFVFPGWPVEQWLERQFSGTPTDPRRDVVMKIVGVDRITFATDQMRRLFETTVGLELPSDEDTRQALTATDAWSEQHPSDFPLPTEPSAMLELALRFLKLARPNNPDDPSSGPLVPGGASSAALIVTHADKLIPNATKAQMVVTPLQLKILQLIEQASTDPALEVAQNPIVLLAKNAAEVHPDVVQASGLRAIRVPLPDYAERLQFIRDVIELKPWLRLEITPEAFAALTAGQNRRDIENITLAAGDQPITRTLVLARGQELMDVRYGAVLKRLEPSFGYEGIGGNTGLKTFLGENVVEPMRNGQTEGVPMGVALLGPPGTGKSAMAMATAYEARVNAIELRNLKDMYVGNSEKNLELLIEGAEMFAPTILLIDEYDKAFAGHSGGDEQHPVDAAMQKRMQEWLGMESHRGRIVLLAAMNYPDRVPPEMIRTGRIDVKAPMLAPETEEERVDILARLLVRYGQTGIPVASLIEFGEPTAGWVGSDLEFAVAQAVGRSTRHDIGIIEALRAAVADVIPADNTQIRAQEQAALRACNLNSLLPRRERERRRQSRAQSEVGPGRLRTAARRNEEGPVI